MGYPRYEKSTGLLIIEWYEKKKDKSATKHYFEQKPRKLQLHPMDPGQIVRVHFSGKLPGWMKNYCEKAEHPFSCEEVQHGDETGWILLNWRSYQVSKQPLIAPNIKGAVMKLASQIDDVCADWRQSLLESADIVSKNLWNYHDLFDPIGVKYRPEEIQGEEGCLVVDHTFFLERMENEADEDFRSRFEIDGRLKRMVKELVNQLPEPIVEETAIENTPTPNDSELERDNDLDFANSLETIEEDDLDLSDSLGHEDDDLDLSGSIEGETDSNLDLAGALELDADQDFDFSDALTDAEGIENIFDESQKLENSLSSSEAAAEDSVKLAAENSEEPSEPNSIDQPEARVLPIVKDSVDAGSPEYLVLDYSHKSSGVIEGQMSIF